MTPQIIGNVFAVNDAIPMPKQLPALDTNAILLQVICRYNENLPTPRQREETFRFYSSPDSENNWQWYPYGSGSRWDETSTPKIPPEPH
jgi:hypothetical protein